MCGEGEDVGLGVSNRKEKRSSNSNQITKRTNYSQALPQAQQLVLQELPSFVVHEQNTATRSKLCIEHQ